MKIKAAYLTDIRKIEIMERDMPVITDDQVLVKVNTVGICGSDIHFFEDGHIGARYVNYPLIPGHEASGTVAEVGKNVSDLQVGDRVSIEPGIPCGHCKFCKEGRYNLCKDMLFMSTPPYDGLFSEYVAIPAHLCFKMPDSVSFTEGALLEPFSVGFHAARLGNVCAPKTVAILGGGCIGLMTLKACKLLGASKVVVSDLFDNRLDMALELGADYVVNAKKVKDVPEAIKEFIGEADVVIETAGSAVTTYQSSFIVGNGGCIVIAGNPIGDLTFNFRNLTLREAELKTVWRYRNTYPASIDAIANGKLDLSRLKVERFAFDDIQNAFDTASNDKARVIKAVIEF